MNPIPAALRSPASLTLAALVLLAGLLVLTGPATAQSGKAFTMRNMESEELLRREKEEKAAIDQLVAEEKRTKAAFLLTVAEDGTLSSSAQNVTIEKVKDKKGKKRIDFAIGIVRGNDTTCELGGAREAAVFRLTTGTYYCLPLT